MTEIEPLPEDQDGNPSTSNFRVQLDAAFKETEENPEQLEAALNEQAIRRAPLLTPFYIENWSPGLRALSMQTKLFSLSTGPLNALIEFVQRSMGGGREDLGEPWETPDIWELVYWAEQAIKGVGRRAFVRTGCRSGKDNPLFMDCNLRPVPVYSGRSAIECLGYSERVYLDLTDCRRANVTPTLCVRRWLDIEDDHEFRCFIEDGKLAGITQYYLDAGHSSWIQRNQQVISETLHDYLRDAVLPLTWLQSMTCDIALSDDMRPTLIEINPPLSNGEVSVYPGLFIDHDLDGSFLFEPAAVARIPEEPNNVF